MGKIKKIDTQNIVNGIAPSTYETGNSLSDFSTFPHIDGHSLSDIQDVSFNNVVRLFYSQEELLKVTGCKFLSELSEKFVSYAIVTETDIRNMCAWYFGHTGDPGERMNTHVKDARSCKRKLYEELRKRKRALVIIFGVFDTLDEAAKLEETLIVEVKNKVFFELTGLDARKHSNIVNRYTKNYIFNIKNK